MAGFFSDAEMLSAPVELDHPRCGACGLFKKCNSPKLQLTGDGAEGILLVGESPTTREDDAGKWPLGDSGEVIRHSLRKAGLNIDHDCWYTSALICKPEGLSEEKATQMVTHCRPNLTKIIREKKPRIIIPMGKLAVEAVLGLVWKESLGSIQTWVGWQIPVEYHNAWVCPTWGTTQAVRSKTSAAIHLWLDKHVTAALKLGPLPNFKERPADQDIKVFTNDEEAADFIRLITTRGELTAFDYESQRLKPDAIENERELISCAIAYKEKGRIKAGSFLLRDAARDAMCEYLLDKCSKIAANMKFEDRWTRRVFGHRPMGLVWDTMLAAHALDCRRDITSVKFQAFVRYGVPPYNRHIEPYFDSDGSNSKNQILQIPWHDLLLYNGYDALYEYMIALDQANEMGIDLE